MKSAIFTVCLLVSVLQMRAAVVVLDQSGTGDYTNLSDAVLNTSPGDTIYVVGASASYGNYTLSSPRTIIGNGYYGQSLGYAPSSAFGTITVGAGASGSIFSSLEISSLSISESGFLVTSCKVGSVNLGAGFSVVDFTQSIFTSTVNLQSPATFTNCIFNYGSSGNGVTVSGGVSVTFDYCTFYDGNLSLNTATITNSLVNSTRVVQTPEIATDAVGGNKVDTEANLLFESSLSQDQYFQLQAGSPALSASQEAGESGAFGFPAGFPETAYRLSGLPEIPRITELDHAASSNTGSGLTIRIQAISN